MMRSKIPIGVDIGSHTVKVCQMRRSGDLYELEKFGMAQIYPSGEAPSDPQEQHQAKVDALKQALAKSQVKARYSVSAVCGESIIVRYLQLPEMPEDEMKKALQWEAEEYIPFRLSEVNLDSMILGRVEDADHPKMDVLLVSAKKDLIENHVSIIREAGMEPRLVDVDAFAFLNCFEVNHAPAKEDCLALINIGGEITSISIYHNNVSRFSRDIPIGGDTITAAIKAHLQCSYAEAERIKISCGAPSVTSSEEPGTALPEGGGLLDGLQESVDQLSQEGQQEPGPEVAVTEAITKVLNNLFSEVRRSTEFFENQFHGANVSRLMLGGGATMLSNLVENFEKEFQLPVEILDPLRRVTVSPRTLDAAQVQALRQQLGVGIGLGIRALAA